MIDVTEILPVCLAEQCNYLQLSTDTDGWVGLCPLEQGECEYTDRENEESEE